MKRIVYSADVGGLPYGELTRPGIAFYAGKVATDLVIIEETNRPQPQHAIFDALEHLAEHEEAEGLWIDLDIVIRENAEDLFEFPGMRACTPHRAWKKHWPKFARQRGIEDIRPYFNSAVLKLSADDARRLLAAENGREWPPVGDQEILNLLWREAAVAWRFWPPGLVTPWFKDSPVASMIHCGGKKKMPKIKRVLKNA